MGEQVGHSEIFVTDPPNVSSREVQVSRSVDNSGGKGSNGPLSKLILVDRERRYDTEQPAGKNTGTQAARGK